MDTKTPKELLEYRELSVKIEEEERERREQMLKEFKEFNLPEELKNKIEPLKYKEKKGLKKLKYKTSIYDAKTEDFIEKEEALALDKVETNEDAKDLFLEYIAEKRGIDLNKYSIPDLDIFIKLILFATLYPLEFEGN